MLLYLLCLYVFKIFYSCWGVLTDFNFGIFSKITFTSVNRYLRIKGIVSIFTYWNYLHRTSKFLIYYTSMWSMERKANIFWQVHQPYFTPFWIYNICCYFFSLCLSSTLYFPICQRTLVLRPMQIYRTSVKTEDVRKNCYQLLIAPTANWLCGGGAQVLGEWPWP